mgnify:CR=1 FL=1
MINDNGVVLSPTHLGAKPLIDKAYYKNTQNPHKGINGLITHLDYRGQKVLCAYQKINNDDLYIASEMDLKEAMMPVH